MLDDRGPAGPDDLRQALGEDLQPGLGSCGDFLDQLQFAVRVKHSGVGADSVHLDPVDTFRGRDQGVGQAPGGQLHDHVVDGDAVAALDHVDAEDVGADRAECRRHRAEGPRAVRKQNPDQERHHAPLSPLAPQPCRGTLDAGRRFLQTGLRNGTHRPPGGIPRSPGGSRAAPGVTQSSPAAPSP